MYLRDLRVGEYANPGHKWAITPGSVYGRDADDRFPRHVIAVFGEEVCYRTIMMNQSEALSTSVCLERHFKRHWRYRQETPIAITEQPVVIPAPQYKENVMRELQDVETDLIGQRVTWLEVSNQWDTSYEGRIRGVVVSSLEPNLIVELDTKRYIYKTTDKPDTIQPTGRRLRTVALSQVTLLDPA